MDISKRKMSLLVSLLLIHFHWAIATTAQWKANKDFDGKIPHQSLVINALNIIHCGRLCSYIANCSSFFYEEATESNCFLLDHIITSFEGLIDMPLARYYTPYEDDATTKSSTTSVVSSATSLSPSTLGPLMSTSVPITTSFGPCPDIYHRFTVQIGPDVFTFKVSSTSGTFLLASSACQLDGGFLARVTSLSKLSYLTSVLSNCQTYPNMYIRIDGTNKEADNFLDLEKWVYSDSSPAVMSYDILSIGYPLLPDIRHCLTLYTNGKIQDYNCESTLDTYVCEYI